MDAGQILLKHGLLSDSDLARAVAVAETVGAASGTERASAQVSRLAGDLPALSDLITQLYLCHLETSRHLAN